jgi:hypothetical protein
MAQKQKRRGFSAREEWGEPDARRCWFLVFFALCLTGVGSLIIRNSSELGMPLLASALVVGLVLDFTDQGGVLLE